MSVVVANPAKGSCKADRCAYRADVDVVVVGGVCVGGRVMVYSVASKARSFSSVAKHQTMGVLHWIHAVSRSEFTPS